MRSFGTTTASSPASEERERPRTSTRHGGTRSRDLTPALVDESANPSELAAREQDIASLESSSLDEHGRDRSPTSVQPRFDDRSSRGAFHGRPDLEQIGLKKNRVEQFVDMLAGQGGDVDEHRVSTPRLGSEALARELLHDPFGLRILPVDLVDGHDDGNARGLRMLDRLVGLGHHPVVGRHDQNHDVGHPRPPRPHRGERRMAGGIEEGDRAALGLNVVGANVLGDPACFAAGHIGASDPVEQGGLSMIDVTHDGHHRRP